MRVQADWRDKITSCLTRMRFKTLVTAFAAWRQKTETKRNYRTILSRALVVSHVPTGHFVVGSYSYKVPFTCRFLIVY